MSFGSTQGTVRYAVIFQDQASSGIQAMQTKFRSMGVDMNTLTSKVNVFNTAISGTGRTFTSTLTPIKNAGNALNQFNLQQKSLTSQLATVGSAFKNNALAIGAAASSVLGLYQNYANLSSAQNNANKAATAAKAANNNLAKAQDNLAKTIAKYGANSKEAQAAQNKLTVAQERAVNKTESAKIAQDNLNQTTADFGINIIPNVILAGSGFTQMLSDMGGTKGLGGLVSKFKGLGGTFASAISGLTGLGSASTVAGTGFSGLGGNLKNLGGSILGLDGPLKGLKGNLLGIGSIAAVGIVGVAAVISDLSAKLKDLKDVSSGAITPVKALSNEFDRWQNFDFTTIEGIGSAIVRGIGPGIPIMGQLKKGLEETTSATIDQTTAGGFLAARQKDVTDAQKNYNDMIGFGTAAQVDAAKAALDHAKKQLALTETFVKSAKAQDTLTVAQEKYNTSTSKTTKVVADNTANWKLQTEALQGGTVKNLNLASQAYLNVHDTIVKTNPAIAQNIAKAKEQASMNSELAKATKNLGIENAITTGTFATMTKFVGGTGKSFVEVGQGMALLTHQTDPFNTKLAQTNTLLPKASTFTQLFGDKMKVLEEATAKYNASHPAAGMDSFNAAIQAGADKFSEFVSQTELAAVTNKRYHDSLLQTVGAQVQLPPSLDLTTSQLESMQTALDNAKVGLTDNANASAILADALDQQLAPSIQKLGGALTALDSKEFKKAFKDLDFGAAGKGFKSFASDLDKSISQINKESGRMETIFSQLSVALSIDKLPHKQWVSGLEGIRKEVVKIGKVQKIDLSGITDFIAKAQTIKDPVQLAKYQKVLALITSSAKGGFNSTELDAIAAAIAGIGDSSGTAAPKVDKNAAAIKTFGVSSASARGQIDQVTGALDLLNHQATAIKPVIIIDNNNALKAIDVIAKRITSLSGINAIISLVNKAAIKAVDVVAKRIDSLTGIKPQISLQNKQAIKAVDVVAKRIDSLEKIKPNISLNNKNAIKAVDVVAKRIDSLSNLHPSVTVKVNYDTSGKPAGIKAQHGFHGTLSETTTILAHKGERVDIGQANSGSGMTSRGGGSGGGDNFFFNIHFGDKEIVKRVKAELGRTVYTMGA